MDRGWLYTRLDPAGRPVPLVDARRTGGVPHASGIIGADEIQAVGRGVEPPRGPIARRERGGDIVGRPLPLTDERETAHHRAHLHDEERPRRENGNESCRERVWTAESD